MPSVLTSALSKVGSLPPSDVDKKISRSFRAGDTALHSPPILISLEVELPSTRESVPSVVFPFPAKSKKKDALAPTSSTGRQLFDKVNIVREIWKTAEHSSFGSSLLPSNISPSAENEVGLPFSSSGATNSGLLTSKPSTGLPLSPDTAPASIPSPLPRLKPIDLEVGEGREMQFPETDARKFHDATSRVLTPAGGPADGTDSEGIHTSRWMSKESNFPKVQGETASGRNSGNELFSQRSASNSFPSSLTTFSSNKNEQHSTARHFSSTIAASSRASRANKGNIINRSDENNTHELRGRKKKDSVQNRLFADGSSALFPTRRIYEKEYAQVDKAKTRDSFTPSSIRSSSLPADSANTEKKNVQRAENKLSKTPQEQGGSLINNTRRGDDASSLSSMTILPSSLLGLRFSHQVEQQVAQNVFLDNFGFYVSREEKAGENALLRDLEYCRVERVWVTEVYPRWGKWKNNRELKMFCRLGVPCSLRSKVWRSLLGVEKEGETRARRRERVNNHPNNNHQRGKLTIISATSTTLPAGRGEKEGREDTKSNNHPVSGNSHSTSTTNSRTVTQNTQGWRAKIGKKAYEDLCEAVWPSELNEKYGSIIEKDIPRTFSTNIFFDSSSCVASIEQEQLRRILRAYCLYNPRVRYCQGMASIAATLLLVMGEEYEAFLCLAVIMEQAPYHLEDYYAPGFPELRRSSYVITGLLKDTVEEVYRILEKVELPVEVFATSWMLTLFSHCFNFRLVCRIWDMFLCEGWKPVFRLVLALLKMEQNNLRQLREKDFLSVSMILQKATEKKDPRTLLKVAQEIKFSTKEMNELRSRYTPAP